MRTIIDLPQPQLDALDRLCRRDGISRAEAVRRAVALLVREAQPHQPRTAFGLWRDRQIDGVRYQARLRREWTTRTSGRPPARYIPSGS